MLDIDNQSPYVLNDKGIEATVEERQAMNRETDRLEQEADVAVANLDSQIADEASIAAFNKVNRLAVKYPVLQAIDGIDTEMYTPEEAEGAELRELDEALFTIEKTNPALAQQIRGVAVSAYASQTF